MNSTELRRNNRELYFNEQFLTTERYVIPYISAYKKIDKTLKILEIGCGEGGNLKYFIDFGCEVVGVDLNEMQLNRATDYTKKFCKPNDKVRFICKDIYDTNHEDFGQFDIIMMRDVIEHIPNQEKFVAFLHKFVKPDGVIFFGFPPWYMPFGGHQQGCKSFLKKVPYFHILPAFLYKNVLKLFGESDYAINSLLEVKSTGISIERFKRAVKNSGWQILDETLYLINPNYEIKFHLKPRKQFPILRSIPFFRNFYTTCAYYIIMPKK
ncbi:MAG: class I SAM-dependent methyltransferase [Chitinophagales bacterium]